MGIIYEPETPLPLLEMYMQGVHFHIGRAMARADMPAVLELAAAGRLRPERVTSRVAGWDDALEAIGASDEARDLPLIRADAQQDESDPRRDELHAGGDQQRAVRPRRQHDRPGRGRAQWNEPTFSPPRW